MIRTAWTPDRAMGDWLMAGADLDGGRDLGTAVALSLFTDRRLADDETPPDGSDDPRGWWADAGRAAGRQLGSRIWTYERAKRTEATRAGVEQAARDALDWLLADRVASRLDVRASFPAEARDRIDIEVILWRGDSRLVDETYAAVWRQLG